MVHPASAEAQTKSAYTAAQPRHRCLDTRLAANCRRIDVAGEGEERDYRWANVGATEVRAMEQEMKIDVQVIKALRDQKAWSQEHLATAAGISLRTVQRIESEGAASAETRLALAGAFGIDVSRLAPKTPSARRLPLGLKIGIVCGSLGWTVGGICSVAGAYNAGHSGAEAGFTYGGIGTFLGLTGACLGAFVNRHLKSLAVDA
jgi:DNA-binding XRE family transcriptional regulator